MREKMNREMYVFVVDFLVSKRTIGELLVEGKLKEAAAVKQMVTEDAPRSLALTDPALYRTLRARITELRIGGL